MVASDALFVYFEGCDVVFFVDTEDMIGKDEFSITYRVYAIDYHHIASHYRVTSFFRDVGWVRYYLGEPNPPLFTTSERGFLQLNGAWLMIAHGIIVLDVIRPH
jgi:hypothetical protein